MYEAVTQWVDGLPVRLREPHDLDFLSGMGRVFRVFDEQDSGNLCFGLRREDGPVFIKYAGAQPLRYDGERMSAIQQLQRAIRVYRELAHPALTPLKETIVCPQGLAAVFEWTDGMCMGKQYPDRDRFLALPETAKLQIFADVLTFHAEVIRRGYVPVDFYDGALLYEPEAGRTRICDVDNYERVPYANPVGRMYGSTRFMAPEEFIKGEPIDERTAVYGAGALAFELFVPGGAREPAAWPLSPAAWLVASQATQQDPERRYQTLEEMRAAWEQSFSEWKEWPV